MRKVTPRASRGCLSLSRRRNKRRKRGFEKCRKGRAPAKMKAFAPRLFLAFVAIPGFFTFISGVRSVGTLKRNPSGSQVNAHNGERKYCRNEVAISVALLLKCLLISEIK